MTYHLATFYKFMPLEKDELPNMKEQLIQRAKELNIKGLILIAEEGINGGFAAAAEDFAAYSDFLEQSFGELNFKENTSEVEPFPKFKVKIKPEIVALKHEGISPTGEGNNHLTPEEWHRMLQEEDVVVIDTRNSYEVRLGKFKGAIDPKTDAFQEFPEFVKKSGIPKDKKVLMYCTEGIRCEKASVEMQQQGYKEVYQLKDGIINYIRQFPNQAFEGECFVFDHRVAVRQDLTPSTTYGICSMCGDPGEITSNCRQCTRSFKTCRSCTTEKQNDTCSKQCRYELKQKANV